MCIVWWSPSHLKAITHRFVWRIAAFVRGSTRYAGLPQARQAGSTHVERPSPILAFISLMRSALIRPSHLHDDSVAGRGPGAPFTSTLGKELAMTAALEPGRPFTGGER